jgi:hypothetical protein
MTAILQQLEEGSPRLLALPATRESVHVADHDDAASCT